MRNLKTAVWLVALTCAAISCSNNKGEGSNSRSKFILTENMDSSVRPQDNFFLYVNGGWLKRNEIPPTESSIGAGTELYNLNKIRIHGILDSVSKIRTEKGSIEQKVGDLYASGMDSSTIEKLGFNPIKEDLQKIKGFKTTKDLLAFEAEQQKINAGPIFAFSVFADEKNSVKNILVLSQSGLGLPDRDYYFKNDPATVKVVEAYKNYAKQAFMLTGDDSISAIKKVSALYAVEKQIAQGHKTKVELRDPVNNYHKLAITEVDKIMKPYSFSSFLNAMGVKSDSVNVQQPAYYAKIATLLSTTPIDTWKAYYQFALIRNAAQRLSSPFVNAAFEYTKTLYGQKQLKPRWERVYRLIDNKLGDALGELYVKKYFNDNAKKRIRELVDNLQTAFEKRINNLDWMSDSTKTAAKDKLHAFIKKVGFTDKWKDYSQVLITRDYYFNNLRKTEANEFAYNMNKIGKSVDKMEFGMTPSTIDAQYDPTLNSIEFPAGILQFPFFDPNADDAVNYGGIGMCIGHEMTHGFDDQGAQYDKDGNIKNWWGKDDNEKFKAKTKLVIDLYSGFTVLDTLHINGALTTGENLADMGGIKIAYDAFKLTKEGKDTAKIDGFTPDQRSFISIGQIWRNKRKDEIARTLIGTDPHSPPMYRVNAPLMNVDAFYTAFNVKEGNKMFIPADKRIKVW